MWKKFKNNCDMIYHSRLYEKCTCDECYFSFNKRIKLRLHITIHSIKYSCYQCSKVLPTKQGLVRHKPKHDKSQDFVCTVYGQSVSISCNLNRHKKHIHSRWVTFRLFLSKTLFIFSLKFFPVLCLALSECALDIYYSKNKYLLQSIYIYCCLDSYTL